MGGVRLAVLRRTHLALEPARNLALPEWVAYKTKHATGA